MNMNNVLVSSKKIFALAIIGFSLTVMLLWPGCHDKDDDNVFDNTDMKLVADGYASPIGVVAAPDNTDRLFVVDQVGKIYIIDSSGNKVTTAFMDITQKMVTLNAGYDERGLLGLAFHPQFATNRRFYIYYQLPPRAGGPAPNVAWNNLSRISEFQASAANKNVADMATEKILLEMDDPQGNHNGGTLAFGPDGFLYIAIGDGGSANDVAPGHVNDWYAANAGGNGQDIEANLFGNVLRIDVNAGTPYGIPADNPFVNAAGKDEIYAYGFRNPFRMSFDMGGDHGLYLGDAGQVLYEEINLVTKGGNYGWNVKEGRHCFNAANNDTLLASCPDMDNLGRKLVDPVIELNNTANPAGGKALTVIGGNVYRGNAIPGLQGKYIFGTYAQTASVPNGELFVATPSGSASWQYDELKLKSFPNDLGHYLKGFGQDNDGEIYLTLSSVGGPSGTGGKVFKLVKAQ
jgi:glucose/arabinose dehydrogenase